MIQYEIGYCITDCITYETDEGRDEEIVLDQRRVRKSCIKDSRAHFVVVVVCASSS
jgi:hypothetical protein